MMYYTLNTKEQSAEGEGFRREMRAAHTTATPFAVGALTSYKKVVDIHKRNIHNKVVHYGLTQEDLKRVREKLKKQKQFLDNSFLYDRINQNHIKLTDIILSANHSPKRYYGEIQNRVNTLERVARQRGLKPLFMTLTLPSEYHPYKTTKTRKRIPNKKYNGIPPREAVKALTTMFARLRQDRALKELTKEDRVYFRVNEPHQDGTPHTHILMFVPQVRINRIIKAFHRLFESKANDIQKITDEIDNSVSYVMKYINKVLPLSKQEHLGEKERYMNAWYAQHRVVRFNSSRTLAPLSLYRLLHHRYSLFALTKLINEKHFSIYTQIDSKKVVKIMDEFGDMVYSRNDNYNLLPLGSNGYHYSQHYNQAWRIAA